jgi:hypothetical protein
MKKVVPAAALLAITLTFLCALFLVQPFEVANAALDRAFGAPPKWVETEHFVIDPKTQETSRGEHPRSALDQLGAHWSGQPGKKRVVLIGNSQMHSMNLAAGEGLSTAPEKTYVDLIPAKPGRDEYLYYRISLGGLSYSEALWYTLYLLGDARLKPDVLIAQINYQALLQAGIREGLLELLADSGFRARVEEEARSNQPYADTFAEALKRYGDQQSKTSATGGAKADAHSFGESAERNARELLARVPKFDSRHAVKDSFERLLYRGRVYFLRLRPSTPRAAGAVRLLRSQMELVAMIRRGREAGVKVGFFQAPVNPAVTLYRTDADRKAYQDFVAGLSSRYGARVWDFEGRLPEKYWGRTLDGPDPLHFGREAHRAMAEMIAGIVTDVEGGVN